MTFEGRHTQARQTVQAPRRPLTDADLKMFFDGVRSRYDMDAISLPYSGWIYDEDLWACVYSTLDHIASPHSGAPRRYRKRAHQMKRDLKWMLAQAHRMNVWNPAPHKPAITKRIEGSPPFVQSVPAFDPHNGVF